MARATAVLNVVALNQSLLGENSPNLNRFLREGELRHLVPVLPAVTCSVQASMLTGSVPSEHGIVGNGWYNRELAEIHFWKQSNHLVRGEKVWETARKKDPSVTVAKLFWWFNMYSTTDYSVTPRPIYKADGRKIPDVYTNPPDLRHYLQEKLGRFPLFHFWGPGSSIRSSRWIADCAVRVYQRYRPTLTLVYLPHLDYGLQKWGPGAPEIPGAVREIDNVVGDLIRFFEEEGVRVLIVSEYGIEPVLQAIPVNRVLREEGLLVVRDEEGLELLDPGGSDAFAVADHQAAHVYCKNETVCSRVREVFGNLRGIERVLDKTDQQEAGLHHPRSGDLVLVAEPGFWFSYLYWLSDDRAPDFARTVDIHRKPGYDPLELFIDPALRLPKFYLAWSLFLKKVGFRKLLDVIPLDTSLVRGSHGRTDQPPEMRPVMITKQDLPGFGKELSCTGVRDVILEHLFKE